MKKVLYVMVAALFMLTGCKAKKGYTSWENVYETPAKTEAKPVAVSTPATIKPAPAAPVTGSNVRVQSEKVTVTHGVADTYCIIVGSFGNPDNALRMMTTLKNEGYSNPCIMKNENNMNRACCASFSTESEARQKLGTVRNKYSDAWLLIRK